MAYKIPELVPYYCLPKIDRRQTCFSRAYGSLKTAVRLGAVCTDLYKITHTNNFCHAIISLIGYKNLLLPSMPSKEDCALSSKVFSVICRWNLDTPIHKNQVTEERAYSGKAFLQNGYIEIFSFYDLPITHTYLNTNAPFACLMLPFNQKVPDVEWPPRMARSRAFIAFIPASCNVIQICDARGKYLSDRKVEEEIYELEIINNFLYACEKNSDEDVNLLVFCLEDDAIKTRIPLTNNHAPNVCFGKTHLIYPKKCMGGYQLVARAYETLTQPIEGDHIFKEIRIFKDQLDFIAMSKSEDGICSFFKVWIENKQFQFHEIIKEIELKELIRPLANRDMIYLANKIFYYCIDQQCFKLISIDLDTKKKMAWNTLLDHTPGATQFPCMPQFLMSTSFELSLLGVNCSTQLQNLLSVTELKYNSL